MANQPVKHDPDRRDDRHDDRRDDRSDDRRSAKLVGEEGALVMPLAEPGPGEPLVGATSVIGDHIEDGERDPHTIAEEQRRRSALYEAGATMEEVATTDLPDAPHETRRVAPPQQQAPHRAEPHPQQTRHPDNPSRR